ncbi:hypothetical protein ACROYT_G038398, partial [Oculina patagonica]
MLGSSTNIMKNLSCMPLISVAESLYPTYITNAVFNAFLSYTAITLNIVTIHAVRKTSSLSKPLKSLLLSLAVSDLGVGLLVQPFYVASLVQWFKQSKSAVCGTYKTFITTTTLFTLASYFSVVLISVDRFLVIHLHLRYKELVTYERVVAVVISVWMFSAFLTFTDLWIPDRLRQLICLARVLLQRSKFIILDEPTAHVDPDTEQTIWNVVRGKLR